MLGSGLTLLTDENLRVPGLTCCSEPWLVGSGQGGGLPLSQPHPDLLPDPPGFGHRVGRRAVRGKHIGGAGGVRLQGGQKAALRHGHVHAADEERRDAREEERDTGGPSVSNSAAKWRASSGQYVGGRDLEEVLGGRRVPTNPPAVKTTEIHPLENKNNKKPVVRGVNN